MPVSRRFNQLVKRLESLRAHLLPPRFSLTGQYSNKDYDLARAYLVLAHAEIEAYCEDRGRKVAQRAHELWKRKGRQSKVLRRLILFHHAEARKPWMPVERSPEKIEKAVNYYISLVEKNHGVREDNLFGMFFPIGIESRAVDNVWLTIMDSFATSRGAVAHTSVKTQQPIDPQGELNRIAREILPGLKKLDRKIGRL